MVSIAIWWITRKYLLGRGLVTVYLEVCRLWNICSTISSPLQLTRCPTSCQSKCPFDPWRTHGPSTLWYSNMAIGNPHNSALCCDMLWYQMDKSWNGGFSIAMFDWLPGVIFKLMKHGRCDLFGRETWGQNGMGTNILRCKMLILQTCRERERERETERERERDRERETWERSVCSCWPSLTRSQLWRFWGHATRVPPSTSGRETQLVRGHWGTQSEKRDRFRRK